MGSIPGAIWSLVGATAYLGTIASAASVLYIGLVFPRSNETYELTDEFPIVFAFQNASLSKHLEPSVWFQILNSSNFDWNVIGDTRFQLSSANFSDDGSEPYFLRAHREIDADDEECPDQGLALNLTDETRKIPTHPTPRRKGPDTCAVLASSSPTPTANPCRVKIDQAVIESMGAVDVEKSCSVLSPPAECPGTDQAVRSLAIANVVSFAAVLGAGTLLLV
ncbi:hypothetical protein CT0861_12047 [Colletotrichum tofieldiae]|uniref:DUF7136 domain-containing protein n=1 Tax=Colletotrichum tofieldiae TaxID=708197 RepID=A0A166MK55_9PEZI|nr:hypothetical protein CT0861_12047 [Colletotrichum tofieldiae]